jgi:hypothetical protein
MGRGGGQHHDPACFTPWKDLVITVQVGGGGAPEPVWTGVENLTTPPGFDHRTVQPVASRYTD